MSVEQPSTKRSKKADAKARHRRENIDVTEGQESLRDFAATFVAPAVAGNVQADCGIFVSQDFVTIHENAIAIPLIP